MKKVWPVFFILSIPIGASCEIETFETIIKTRKYHQTDARKAIKRTNCSSKILSSFLDILSSGRGSFLTSLFHKDVQVFPSKINLFFLDEFVSRSIGRSNWSFGNGKFTGGGFALYLEKGEKFFLDLCSNCHKAGERNLKINISSPSKNQKRVVWIRGEMRVKREIFFAKRNLAPWRRPLEREDFGTKVVFSAAPERFFSNGKKMGFYKLVKTKKAGEPLLISDLVSINLVSRGKPAQVRFLKNGIKLSGMAMPLGSGKFGERIKLKNISTKKIITGKVIGFNKVGLEL